MTARELREALHAGTRVYGTAITAPAPRWPEAVGAIGLDFVFLDTEHIPLDRQQLSWMCQAYKAMALPPLVRIPSPDPYAACQVLDGGAAGVIAPYVESPEQVQALRGAVRYRPLKGRRLAEKLAGREALEPELDEYLAERNDDSMLIVNIESAPAIEALDAILDVPGLDAVLVGPHDLSCSLGIPEHYDHPRFIQAVNGITTKARARGVGAGIHFSGAMNLEIEWARNGLNLIIHSSDFLAFRERLQAHFAALKATLGDECGGEDGSADTTI
ncbi:MAG TPA: aldolase/citrate lyase family protein [Candidatus Hydrogenedentes bacterium]|nr:aldolase/citrate lyase family protein [Candidatus Hydrogenedentota bacterium]HPG70039.1 aldolase/citrate lyase family protein [Candidatus Hydrogenedentota bacterium]